MGYDPVGTASQAVGDRPFVARVGLGAADLPDPALAAAVETPALGAVVPTATVIGNSGAAPFSAVAHLLTAFGSSVFQGSGVLVAPDELLTVSHLVWNGLSKATAAAIGAGQNENSLPFGAVAVTGFHFNAINDLFGITAGQTHRDYALLHLAQPVLGAQTMLLDPSFQGGGVHISGYPAQFPFDGNQDIDLTPVTAITDPFNAVLQFSPTGSFQGLTRQVVLPGSSGSPLWFADAFGRDHVVGLVSAGSSVSVNATWITPDVESQIVGWYLADHPSPVAAALPAAEVALFDSAYYLIKNPDIMAIGADALQHFTTTGWIEHRNPDNFFDVTFYLQHNPDVARLGMDPLLHYAQFGWKEGRDPSASFSTNHYLSINPDVKLAGLDPLQHYLQFGLAEHRPI